MRHAYSVLCGVMSQVLLFHSALSLSPWVLDDAERLRRAGYSTGVPDFYDGQCFGDLAAGLAKRDELGGAELVRRSLEAAASEHDAFAFAGYSLGGTLAAVAACGSPRATRLVLFSEAVSPDDLELDAWPARLSVQVHVAGADPWIDVATLRTLGDAVAAAGAEFAAFAY